MSSINFLLSTTKLARVASVLLKPDTQGCEEYFPAFGVIEIEMVSKQRQ